MFKDNDEFENWAKGIGLNESAILMIKNIRESEPARRVRSGPLNVGGRFARSRKMNHTIQHESRTVEFPALLMMELDYLYAEDDVIEIWDQPPSFVINYKGANERNLGHSYTADFFVIRRNSAGWEEWKVEEKLYKEFEKNPAKYYQDENGVWHFPPGENYASSFDLYFHVHSSAEIDWTLYRNLKLLLPLYNSSFEVPSQLHYTIQSCIKTLPGISLAELREEIEEANNIHVFQLLLTKTIFINLREAWLGDEEKVRLFPDEITYNYFVQSYNTQFSDHRQNAIRTSDILPNTTVRWDGLILEVVLVGETEIMLRTGETEYQTFSHKIFEQLIQEKRITDVHFRPTVNRESDTYKLIKQIGSSDALKESLHRFNIIKPALEGKKITDTSVNNRTHRNWLNDYEASKLKTGDGLAGLIPRHYLKGNRTDRLEIRSQGLRQKMEDFIADDYENPVVKTKSLSYGGFSILCESEGIQSPSLKTYVQAINHRAGPEQTEKMLGKKAAYQQEEFNDWSNGIPVHGDRPWEFVHIDHTPVDIELKHSTKGIEMVVAWVSLMFDSFSRKVLAYYLTFDPPSYRSCMGLMRECVRLYGRLPECIIVDGGKEFFSIFFEKLLARYRCDIMWRPPTKPRYGCLIERFIHTFNKEFIHNLLGNRKIMKNVRQITKEVNPKNQAVWNFPLLDLHMEDYFYDEYPNKTHSSLGQSPNEAYSQGISNFPVSPPEQIAYDDNLLIETMPAPRKRTVKLIRSRGVKFMGYFYRSNKLRRPDLYGKQLEIRYDPFSYAHVYVFVENEWVECFAPPSVYAELKNKTEREIKIITEEQRALNKRLGRNYKVGLIEAAKKHARRESVEKLEKQHLQDNEFRKSAEQRGIKLSPGRSHLLDSNVINQQKDSETETDIATEIQSPKIRTHRTFPRAFNQNKHR
jgi:putative transposase